MTPQEEFLEAVNADERLKQGWDEFKEEQKAEESIAPNK